MSYALFHKKTGAWLGEVRNVDCAADAIREWVDSFGGGTGIVASMIRAERLPA